MLMKQGRFHRATRTSCSMLARVQAACTSAASIQYPPLRPTAPWQWLPMMPSGVGAIVTPVSGRRVVVSGSSAQILGAWADTMGSLRPGDTVVLSPAGGVLEVPPGSPLDITGPVTVTSAVGAPPVKGPAAAEAPPGAVAVRCAMGAEEAIAIRWALGTNPAPGAVADLVLSMDLID